MQLDFMEWAGEQEDVLRHDWRVTTEKFKNLGIIRVTVVMVINLMRKIYKMEERINEDTLPLNL